jgi:hypothetical protein
VATVTLAADVSCSCVGTNIVEGIAVNSHVEIMAVLPAGGRPGSYHRAGTRYRATVNHSRRGANQPLEKDRADGF